MKKKILGISRSTRFSPNSAARDEAIFQTVTEKLRSEGFSVHTISEDTFESIDDFQVVFSMARDEKVLQTLAKEERRGLRMLNSAQSLLRGSRVHMTTIFEQAGIPIPHSPWIFRSEKKEKRPAGVFAPQEVELPFPFWMKRSEACAQSAGDVRFITTEAELEEALAYYKKQDIHEVLASEHLEGDLVKFYGVEGTDFFYCHYPTADHSFSKFGLEQINGSPSGYPLDQAALKKVADKAATLSGLEIYGGDCIVDAQGQFRIIDFNDWPSFSRCCQEAAEAIARKVMRLTE
jgi:hypothetical protein